MACTDTLQVYFDSKTFDFQNAAKNIANIRWTCAAEQVGEATGSILDVMFPLTPQISCFSTPHIQLQKTHLVTHICGKWFVAHADGPLTHGGGSAVESGVSSFQWCQFQWSVSPTGAFVSTIFTLLVCRSDLFCYFTSKVSRWRTKSISLWRMKDPCSTTSPPRLRFTSMFTKVTHVCGSCLKVTSMFFNIKSSGALKGHSYFLHLDVPWKCQNENGSAKTPVRNLRLIKNKNTTLSLLSTRPTINHDSSAHLESGSRQGFSLLKRNLCPPLLTRKRWVSFQLITESIDMKSSS